MVLAATLWGFNSTGAMSNNLMRAETVRNMADSVQQSIINKFSTIYTDEKNSLESKALLQNYGVQVIFSVEDS